MMNREEVITRTLEMHHRYALSTGSAAEQLDCRVILLIVLCPVKEKKKFHSDLNLPAFLLWTLFKPENKSRESSLFALASHYLCDVLFLFPVFVAKLLSVYAGISVPKVKLRLCSAASLLGFAQLKRIKADFFFSTTTAHNYRVRNESWRSVRDPTMEEEKLVHPIVTARTLPHGDRKETNTCRIKKKNPNSHPYSFFLLFEYWCIHSCVSHSLWKRSSWLFSPNTKAVFTV